MALQPFELDVRFDTEIDSITAVLKGDLSIADIAVTMKAIRANPDYELHVPALWDLQQASLANITAQDIQLFKSGDLVKSIENPTRPAPVALVTQRVVDRGIIRQIIGAMGWSEIDFFVFDDIESAIAWIRQRQGR